jgi:hypothetical protein
MYSRRKCELCDDARAVIRAVQDQVVFEFREVFIDGDDRLERSYGLRVPVVLIDGEEEFEIEVDRERFIETLRN